MDCAGMNPSQIQSLKRWSKDAPAVPLPDELDIGQCRELWINLGIPKPRHKAKASISLGQ